MIVRDVQSVGYSFRLILVDDLNPEDAGMVSARKARSGESSVGDLEVIYAARREAFAEVLKQHVNGCYFTDATLDAIMAVASHADASALARRFNQQWLVGYNHKSIADCATGATIIVEGVSMLAAKALEHHPLFSGQETSTRAVDMTKAKLVDPLGTDESRTVHRRFMDFYERSWDATAEGIRERYPRTCDDEEKKYEAAVKYRTFDVLRAWIPAGAATSLSLTMNLRQFGDHLANLLLHPLAEVREVAVAVQAMLRERYPSSGSFGGAAGVSGVGLDGREAECDAWNRQVTQTMFGSAYQEAHDGGRRYSDTLDNATLHLLECESGRHLLQERPRGCLLPQWMADLGQVSCTFALDFGSYRDIERHRNGVCRMPLLTARGGFEPWYIDQLPERLQVDAQRLLKDGALADHLPCSDVVRQYYIPMGCTVPVSVTYGLPAFAYVVELRSSPTVHTTLRRAVLKHMVEPFRRAHPEVLLHVDESEDPWDLRRGQQTIEKR